MKRIAWLVLLLLPAVAACAADNPYSGSYPDPERFRADIVAWAEADSIAMPEPGALLCLGSSSIRMWHSTLERDLAPRRLILRGFGGSTMWDVLSFDDRIVYPYRPAAILLYEGDNDIDFGVAPDEFLAAFDEFVARLHARLPETRLYFLSIKPSGLRWGKWPLMAEANAAVARRCADDPLLTYLDVATPLLGQNGEPDDSLFLPDRLHLNEKGYAVWTQVVNEIVPVEGF